MTKRKDYIQAVGRRKTAVARVRLKPQAGKLDIKVNDRDFKDYFGYGEWQNIIIKPLQLGNAMESEISIKVNGGGIKAQAEAIRLGIARALIEGDIELRASMKKAGFLTRDSRKKERKKPGLKRARRAPQWSKR